LECTRTWETCTLYWTTVLEKIKDTYKKVSEIEDTITHLKNILSLMNDLRM